MLGFTNETEMEAYAFARPQEVQGNYLFNSPDAKTVTQNPKPCALNPSPSVLYSKPYTLILNPSTLNPRP